MSDINTGGNEALRESGAACCRNPSAKAQAKSAFIPRTESPGSFAKTDKNILWVDYIRIIAIFTVVFVHCLTPFLYRYNEIPHAQWWVVNIVNAIARVCLPLFFMISGFLLLGKTEPIKDFFAKRFNKVAVPFIFWSYFYLFWKVQIEGSQFTQYQLLDTLMTPSYYHLWFLHALIGLYLCIPVIRPAMQTADKASFRYFAILWLISAGLLPLIYRTSGIHPSIDLSMISGSIGYLMTGYILGKMELKPWHFYVSLLLTTVITAVTAYATYYLTVNNTGTHFGYAYDCMNLNIMCLSIGVFIIMRYLGERDGSVRSERYIRGIKDLSAAGFGIYLVHPALICILCVMPYGWLNGFSKMNPIYSVPVMTIVIFMLSYITTAILRRIPIIRRSVQ